MNLLSAESIKRNASLELSLIDLHENLRRPEVMRNLGRQATRVTSEMLDLLFIPNIRHGELHIPYSVQKTEGIPLIGLNDGEIIKFGESASKQTSNQEAILQKSLWQWLGGPDNPDIPIHSLMSIVKRRHIAEMKKPQGMQLSGRVLGAVSHVTSAQRLRASSEDVLIHGRPIVGIRIDTTTPKDQTLIHELDHAHMHLTRPAVKGPSSDATWRAENRQHLELSASRSGARYGQALYGLQNYKDYGNPDLLNDVVVESARLRHCDPKRPLYPTPEMMHEIWEETGFTWSAKDFMRQAA